MISGCIDPLANNYNSDASFDDGSCTYQDNGNYYLSFDGVDDYVDISNSHSLNFGESSISYSLWFKKPESTHYLQSNLITNYKTSSLPCFGLYINGTYESEGPGKIRLFFRNNENAQSELHIVSSDRYDDNQWHHVVAVKDVAQEKILLYVDGNLVGEESVDMGITDTEQGFVFASGHLGRYMDVELDEIIVTAKTYNSDDVSEIYNGGSNFDLLQTDYDQNALKGYWKFNHGDGDLLYDFSGNQNHGTINGSSWNEFPIYGCTDPLADNYSEDANIDDGSCINSEDFSDDYSIEMSKLIASDASAGDDFGRAVDIDGDYAIVGAKYADHSGLSDPGAAYIYVRDGDMWVEQAKLIASDASSEDMFSFDAVAISGNYAIVGAAYDDTDASRDGSAYIFVRDGQTWSQHAKLNPEGGGAWRDEFGAFVDIDGDYVIVGMRAHPNPSEQGAAIIFFREGDNWIQQQKITSSDGEDMDVFGTGVAISGDYVAVGAPYENEHGYQSGAIYVFHREGTTWTEQAKLTASDADAYDNFGYKVAIYNDYILGGSRLNDDNGSNSGSAYIFHREGDTWSEQIKLTVPDAGTHDRFGCGLAISENYAVIGAENDDDAGHDAGAAYVFYRNGSRWTQVSKLTPSDGNYNGTFGFDLAISGNYIISGALGDNEAGEYAGAAYIYRNPVSGCTDPYANNYDEEATINNGTCFGYPQEGENALSFDGIDDLVDISVNVDNDFTLMGWLNYNTADDGNAILASSSNDFLRLDQNRLGYNSPTGANHIGSTTLENQSWYHFAVVRSDVNLDFFINSINDGSFNESQNSLEWIKIGVHRNGYQHMFNGMLDQISIWNVALTQDQIASFMDTDFDGNENGLVALWKFNSGDGDILYDHSGNLNHGTIHGAT